MEQRLSPVSIAMARIAWLDPSGVCWGLHVGSTCMECMPAWQQLDVLWACWDPSLALQSSLLEMKNPAASHVLVMHVMHGMQFSHIAMDP
jgi:hypothetical protein